MSFSWIGLILVGIILLPNILYAIFPPKKKWLARGKEPIYFLVLERIGQIACSVIPVLSGIKTRHLELNIWTILMAICIGAYEWLWAGYFHKGREEEHLYASLWKVKMPMAKLPVWAFIFMALWFGSGYLLLAALILRIGHYGITRLSIERTWTEMEIAFKERGRRLKLLSWIGNGIVFLLVITATISFGVGYFNKTQPAYGHRIEVEGRAMNIYEEGQGEQSIVMLSGLGTPYPAEDFEPLISELKDKYHIYVIEGFGYGYSEAGKTERTVANICEELHEAIKSLGLKQYILMPHSISNVYALNYVNHYGDEVKALIAIDGSVPDQITYEKTETKMQVILYRLVGLVQDLGLIHPKMVNDTIINEASYIEENLNACRGDNYPKDLPVLFFIATDSEKALPFWKTIHENLLKPLEKGELCELEAAHYMHHTQAKVMSEKIKVFLETIQ